MEQPKRRGRPPGSKNKPKELAVAPEKETKPVKPKVTEAPAEQVIDKSKARKQPEPEEPKKKRGRPPKVKPVETETPEPEQVVLPESTDDLDPEPPEPTDEELAAIEEEDSKDTKRNEAQFLAERLQESGFGPLLQLSAVLEKSMSGESKTRLKKTEKFCYYDNNLPLYLAAIMCELFDVDTNELIKQCAKLRISEPTIVK